jgi:glycosyltransferase involved in cell wall biosynthesis
VVEKTIGRKSHLHYTTGYPNDAPMLASKRKILYVCTEDWFFHSHFLPLIEAAKLTDFDEIFLATSTSGKHREIEKLGVKIIPVEFDRASKGFFSTFRLLGQLTRAIYRLKPDVIHFISLKPVLVGGLAALFIRAPAKVFHITGLGTLGEGNSVLKKLLRSVVFRLPGLYLRQSKTELLVENPDDLDYLKNYGTPSDTPATILGGAGVDPDLFPDLSLETKTRPKSKTVHLAFVGRMIKTKGIDVLVDAMASSHVYTLDAQLDLYGIPDTANPGSYRMNTIEYWSKETNITYHGFSPDVVTIWKNADICVVPTRTREGLPRAMLEAAVCARPLIVTDVPGCRHFVEDGVQGLVVPPEDVEALALAIARLVNDPQLRKTMGKAARQRVLDSFTKTHVINDVAKTYDRLLNRKRP